MKNYNKIFNKLLEKIRNKKQDTSKSNLSVDIEGQLNYSGYLIKSIEALEFGKEIEVYYHIVKD